MFNPNTAFSKRGEDIARKLLTKLEWNCYDVSNIETTWPSDIDLIATKGNIARLVEVKYDNNMSRTGNMFIELVKDK